MVTMTVTMVTMIVTMITMTVTIVTMQGHSADPVEIRGPGCCLIMVTVTIVTSVTILTVTIYNNVIT